MKIENIEISALAYGGSGIGRLSDGKVCFVPGTLPGEVVKIRVLEEKKQFSRGEVIEIIHASKQRQIPECYLFGQCPGCTYMHCSYSCEVMWKHRQLRDFIVRNKIADESVIQEPFASPESLYYRNKITLHRNTGGCYGYYGVDNETVLSVKECLLADRKINDLLPEAIGETALFRCTSQDGALQVDCEEPGILHEFIPGSGEFNVAGNGFFQTNIPVAAELVRMAKDVFASDASSKVMLELYCGTGIFSIALADMIPELRCNGIEINRQAIGFAKINAGIHGVADRCKFMAGDALQLVKRWHNHPEVTILADPPRSGMSKEVLNSLIAIQAKRIIYISCAADTLVRDLQKLISSGYRVTNLRMLDMFPRTAHFEVFTVLEKSSVSHPES